MFSAVSFRQPGCVSGTPGVENSGGGPTFELGDECEVVARERVLEIFAAMLKVYAIGLANRHRGACTEGDKA